MRIIITGSPGTGKSAVSKILAKSLDLELIDIKKIVNKEKLHKGKSHEVDIKKLKSALAFLKNKDDYLAEGHLACELPLPGDFVFVLRTSPKTLRARLKKRKYGRKKLDENIMAEMLDYCTQRARACHKKLPLEVETSGLTARQTAEKILRAVRQKKKKLDDIDYSDELKKYLELS